MRKIFLIISLIIYSLSVATGQDIRVSAKLDTSRIYIGDQINYTVTVEQPEGLILALKPLKDTLCGKIEILSGPSTDTTAISGGRIKYTGKYLITSFDSGVYEIPPFYAELNNESGLRRFYSDYVLLEVIRVKIAPQDTTAKIFDIVSPYKAPVTIGEILPWILLAAAAGALVWGIVLLWRRFRREKKKPEEVIPTEPAHEIAFRDLEKLNADQLWQKGEVKLYYSRLTEIVRQYLENRYKVYSLEMTTSETLEELRKTGFRKDESYNLLKSVLTGSDLVKFAKYKPEPSENEKHFQDSWKFVKNTMEKEVINAEEPAKAKEEVKS